MKSRVLVIDDAQEIRDVVVAALEVSGYETSVAASGNEALLLAREWLPQVVILDLSLPDVDGVEVCRQLHTFSNAYVLMLTARGDEIDRVVGLTVGADDYVTKPFSPRELVARVGALLRRARANGPPAEVADHETRRFGPLTVDVSSREVGFNGEQVILTKIEFDILDVLTEKPKRVVPRAQLRERVWGPNWFGDDHAVDVHVSNLRKKLAAAGGDDVVATVRGVGYRLATQLIDDAK